MYHYTTNDGARDIFLSDTIKLFLGAIDDGVHGNGVYLTTVDPNLGKRTGLVSLDFRTRSLRDILTFVSQVTMCEEPETGVELDLADYNWSLKSWEGELLATQYLMANSLGKAARKYGSGVGRYIICQGLPLLALPFLCWRNLNASL